MFIHNLNPVLLDLGPVEIRWYGVVYVFGFFLTFWWFNHLSKKGYLKLTKDEITDFVFYLMVGVLVGSRLFMVFWDPSYYLTNPLRLLKIWEGGMSFHGGFTGIIVACYLYCRKKKLSFLTMADFITFPTMFALALGRVANFINGELWGTAADPNKVSWCVNFKNTGGGDVCRHPQQLYAAGYRFLLSFWLLFLTFKHKFKAGFLFWNFMLLEGIGRFIVDFWRDDPRFLILSLGQWFSAIMILIALTVLIKNYREDITQILSTKN